MIDFGGAQFAFINMLRTGNPTLDMVICMMIPAVFAFIFSSWETHGRPRYNEFMAWLTDGTSQREFRRDIEYEIMRNSWGSVLTGQEERNNVLQKAITLFLNTHNINYKIATCSLMSIKESAYDYEREDDDGNDGDAPQRRGGAGALRKYKITTVAPNNTWVTVAKGLEFRQVTEENNEGDGKKTEVNKQTIIFSFRSFEPNGEKIINDFVDKAWDFYLKELDKSQDISRYMYNLSIESAGAKDEEKQNADVRRYKRYKLSDEKTFNSLFFPDKDRLLSILHNFKTKSGKYAIEGYPHKLGVLLHGPPGTGKTSLIKALAHATGRSIVNIPLARIRTNQELFDLVYDLRFSVPGEDVPIKLSYKNIIFVMEDVDAASKIVQRRDQGGSAVTKAIVELSQRVADNGATTTLLRQTSVAEPILKKSTGGEDGGEDKEKAGDDLLGEDTEGMPQGPLLPGQDLMDLLAESGDKTGKGVSSFGRTDKLDLSGLLNVLDGVVDTPNRILVMTTNHPEKLDPALIRPGRIDKKLFLGYMAAREAALMLQHYFPTETVTDKHRAHLHRLLDVHQLNMTPAQVEQICAEHDTIDEMITALEDHAHPIMAGRGLSRAASIAMRN